MIIVNFKTYDEGTGKNAVELAKICQKVAEETGKEIVIAVQELDLGKVSEVVTIPVYSEHLDPITAGAHTGHNLPKTLKENGATGAMINHSEDRYPLDMIKASIEIAREVGLKTIVCANDPEMAEEIASFNPDMIAVEPPELIGGVVSVSTAKPEIITETVEKVHNIAKIPVLCGAGVKNSKDYKKAIELGAAGVLLASGVVKAENPEQVLRELTQ